MCLDVEDGVTGIKTCTCDAAEYMILQVYTYPLMREHKSEVADLRPDSIGSGSKGPNMAGHEMRYRLKCQR